MEPIEYSNEEMILSFLAEGGDDFVSGAALSDKLGLSRTAVWKHVETLRRLGYRIEAQKSRGYRLLEVPDRLTALELSPLLSTRELGRFVHSFEAVTSTNAAAFALAHEGAVHGEIVIAESQTEGRGRRGRSWASPPGLNLYFSAILRPELVAVRAPEVTLVTAVAVAETIRDAGAPAEIKWPNDVVVGGRKVAGILSELSTEGERVQFIVVGVGVNLNARPDDLPAELAATATSVMMARGQRVPRALFTAALWAKLEGWLDRWAEEGFAPVREATVRLSALLGHPVVVREGDQVLEGTAVDIDAQGALVIDHHGRRTAVLAGDVERVRIRDEPPVG